MNSLRRYGVDTSYILRGGDRIGLYYSEKGASQRADQVIYDRKYSAFSLSREDEYAWDEIFNEAKWFHFTGITPALGENCFKIAERAAKEAKLHNAIVSCDVNYRKGLWNIKQARAGMERLLAYTDVCIANESQISELFGLSADENGNRLAEELMHKFDFKLVALTYRRTINANRNNIWATLFDGKDFVCSKRYELDMVDRIGGGDAFSAGLIYARMHNYDLQKSVEFAEAANCLKHSIEGDFNLATVEEVAGLARGKAFYEIIR